MNGLKTLYARFSDIGMGKTLEDGVDLGQVSETLEKVGVEVLNSEGKMNSVGDIMEDLMAVWSELDTTQKNAIATTLAGKYQLSRFNALMNRSDMYDEFKSASENADGTMDEMNQKYLDSLEGRLKTLQATFEDLINSFATGDNFTGFIDGLTQALQLMTDLTDAIGGGSVALQGLGAIATKVFSSQLADGIQNIRKSFGKDKLVKEKTEAVPDTLKQMGVLVSEDDALSQKFLDFATQSTSKLGIMSEEQQNKQVSLMEQTGEALMDFQKREEEVRTSVEATNKAYKLRNQLLNIDGRVPRISKFEGETDAEKAERKAQGVPSAYLFDQVRGLPTKQTLTEGQLNQIKDSSAYQNVVKGYEKTSSVLNQYKTKLLEIQNLVKTSPEGINMVDPEDIAQVQKLAQELRHVIAELQEAQLMTEGDVLALGEGSEHLKGVYGGSKKHQERWGQNNIEQYDAAIENLGLLEDLVNKQRQVILDSTDVGKVYQNASDGERAQQKRDDAYTVANTVLNSGGDFLKDLEDKDATNNILDLVGGLGEVAFAIQGIQNLGSIWENSDLTSSEKFTQMLMNLAMTAPAVVDGVHAMTAALTGLGVSMKGIMGLSALLGVVGGIATAIGAYQAQIKETQRLEVEAFDKARTNAESVAADFQAWKDLQKEYKETGVASEEFIAASERLVQTLGSQTDQALLAAGAYDALSNSLTTARDKQLEEVARESQNVIKGETGQQLRGENGFFGGESSLSMARTALRDATGTVWSNVKGNAKKTENNSIIADIVGDVERLEEMNVPQQLREIAQIEKEITAEEERYAKMSDEALEAYGGRKEVERQFLEAKKSLAEYTTDENVMNYDNALRTGAEQLAQTSEIQKKLESAGTNVEEIKKVFAEDSGTSSYFKDRLTESEQLAFAIENVADVGQKTALSLEKSKIDMHDMALKQLKTEDAANAAVEEARRSLTDEQFITFVGQLDEETSFGNIRASIEKFQNSEAGKINFFAGEPTGSDFEETVSNKQNLKNNLIDPYEKNGGFTEDEYAQLIIDHPEYIDYLEREGELYHVNKRALTEYNQAIRDQTQAVEEARGEDIDLSRQNEYLGVVKGSAGEDTFSGELQDKYETTGFSEDQKEILRGTLDELRSLNTEFMNTDMTSDAFLDKLGSSFDDLTNKIKDTGMSASDFFDTISGQNMSNFFADELYQGVQRASKQFKSGKITAGEYGKTLQKAGQQSIKMRAAQEDLTDEQVSQIRSTKNLEDVTQGMTSSQKRAAKEIKKMSKSLEDLDSASDFNNFVTENFDEIMSVFDNSGHVLEEAQTEQGHIQEQYRGTIEKTATEIAKYYQSNSDAATVMASKISTQFGITEDEAMEMITSSSQLSTAMMGDAKLAGTVMSGTAAQTTAAVSNMAQGLSAMLTAVMMSVSSMDASVDASASEGGFTSFPIKVNIGGKDVSNEAGGQIMVPGFHLKIKGSGGGGRQTAGVDRETSFNSETGKYETEIYQNDDGGANPGLSQGTVDATPEDVLGYGVDKFESGMNSFIANGGMSQFAPPGHTSGGGGGGGRGGGGGGGGRGGGGGGGGRGGGGGGGSEKTYEPKKKDLLEEETDRYERVDTLLEAVENDLDKVADEFDRVTGFQIQDNMEKQIALIKRQVELHKQKLEIQKQEVQELRNELSQYGIGFDSEGFISNYQAIHQQLIDNVRSLQEQYNNTTTEEGQNQLEKQIEEAEKRLDKFKEKYERYDELWAGDIKETEKAIEDLFDTAEDLAIEVFEKSIEAADNIKDIQEQLVEFDMVFTGLRSDDPFRGIAESTLKIKNYFDVATDSVNEFYDNLIKRSRDKMNQEGVSDEQKKWLQQQIDSLEKAKQSAGNQTVETHGTGFLDMQLTNMATIMEQIRQFEKDGASSIFGENSADLYEIARDVFDAAASAVLDLEKEIENLEDSILDAIDEIGDSLDRRTESFQNLNDELEHQLNIMEMIHGDKAYDKIGQLLGAQNEVQSAQIKEQMAQLDYWKNLLKEMNPKVDSEEWKAIQDKIVETQKNVNDLVESSLETLQRKYENTVNSILDTWTNNAFGGDDLDWVNTQWELINRNASYYLDETNKAYSIQKLQGKYLQMLDNANGLHIQQQITEQMNQQLKYLRDKKNLSEYDVAYANAQLEILQKRLALEEAERNKSQMKLKRDSQGNYSYVYTANKDDLAGAKDELLDAQNNAYNMAKDQMVQTQTDSLSALQDAKAMLAQIWTDANLSLEEKTKRTKVIMDSLKEYLNATSEQLSTAEEQVIESFIGMVDMTLEENKDGLQGIYDQIVSGNKDAFDQIDTRWSTSISSWLQNLDSFNTSTETALGQLTNNFTTTQENIAGIGTLVNQDFNNVSTAITDTKDKMDELVNSTGDFYKTLNDNAGTLKQAEADLKTYRDKLADVTNEMKAYKSQVDDLASKLTKKEQENANLQTTIDDLRSQLGIGGGGSGSGGDLSDGAQVGDWVGYKGWYYYDSWGQVPAGHWGEGQAGAVKIDGYSAQRYGGSASQTGDYAVHLTGSNGWDLGWVKESQLFDTGGYTGNWGSGEGLSNAKNGKMAILHNKELVLNSSDTENILRAVEAVREITSQFKSGLIGRMTSLAQEVYSSADKKSNRDTIQQEVHITAEFPNVNSASEIEQALLSLNDTAAQYTKRIR